MEACEPSNIICSDVASRVGMVEDFFTGDDSGNKSGLNVVDGPVLNELKKTDSMGSMDEDFVVLNDSIDYHSNDSLKFDVVSPQFAAETVEACKGAKNLLFNVLWGAYNHLDQKSYKEVHATLVMFNR
ncbi:MAG: hypothetical protein H6845_02725 [Alphaproteobacteria bacterium]|nr:MAG: hypothetical protein H6845_02725 [Alphaproteobacteria bacterium]